jgi:RimJ/RimL family protein N-acetyltransferase
MTPLTLARVAAQPSLLTWQVALPSGEPVVLRPLMSGDAPALAAFLAGLSPQTRHFWHLNSYDLAQAQALCDAIARYDKLRFVVERSRDQGAGIIGLMEFSFDLTDGDQRRYAGYGIELVAGRDCRFGPCLADSYQGTGAGVVLFPPMVEVARRFAQERIILWGGVLAANQRAIRFYERVGFRHAGSFVDAGGDPCEDMLYAVRPKEPTGL